MWRHTGSNICATNHSSETITSSLPRLSLLLAGGDGSRLQELTREVAGVPIPKQYCRLLRGSSLLEVTLARAHLFSPHNQISVIVNENHLALAKEQIKSLPKRNIFIQPLNRDTGPGLILSLLNIKRCHPDAIVAAFPTDHYIENDALFMDHALRAAEAISEFPDKIAILGVRRTGRKPDMDTSYRQARWILPTASIKWKPSSKSPTRPVHGTLLRVEAYGILL
jgi:mannose-1-phosphate guanylyltransferase